MTFSRQFLLLNSELPDFEPKVNEKDNIDIINIKPEKVLKQLKNLNLSKSCGPDNCLPFFQENVLKRFISHYLP